MSDIKVKQLPSRYFLKDGEHHIEYFFQISEGFGYFTDIATLWKDAVGTDEINFLHEAHTQISYTQQSRYRAIKYRPEDLARIFSDLLVEGSVRLRKTETPEKFKVKSY